MYDRVTPKQAGCHAVFTALLQVVPAVGDGMAVTPSVKHPKEVPMAGTNEPVRIKLTPEQQEMVKRATGKSAEALELSAQELEERIAPAKVWPPK
jgi:hypothetical protein